jgi:hypothetical protein
MLRIEIERSEAGIRLHQNAFICDILAERGMMVCNPARTPAHHELQLTKLHDSVSPVRHDEYRRVVGPLQYLAGGTRPDISFCDGYLGASVIDRHTCTGPQSSVF